MLKGKNAIVTGGSRGIGKAIALKLASLGANVTIIATSESDSALAVVDEIRSMGVEGELVAADVADAVSATEAVKKITDTFGDIHILVNNAGITRDRLLMKMSEDDFDSVISVNLKGCFNMTKAVIRSMVKGKYGRIINISSVVGLMGNVGQSNYAASKAGIIGFTKSVAKEYALKGITCNAVAPGFIETDMTDAINPAAKEAILQSIPQKRGGTPDDVASLVAFLSSDHSSYITGETIRVDGGMYI